MGLILILIFLDENWTFNTVCNAACRVGQAGVLGLGPAGDLHRSKNQPRSGGCPLGLEAPGCPAGWPGRQHNLSTLLVQREQRDYTTKFW